MGTEIYAYFKYRLIFLVLGEHLDKLEPHALELQPTEPGWGWGSGFRSPSRERFNLIPVAKCSLYSFERYKGTSLIDESFVHAH